MPSITLIGSRIAVRRKAPGLTQKDLAGRAHISRSTVDALENGRIGELGFSKITRLLGILGLELILQDASSAQPTLDDLVEANRNDQSLGRQR